MPELVERPKVPGVRDNFGHGHLLVVDLARVDRAWTDVPAMETIERVRNGTFAPAIDPPLPGQPLPADPTGLDVALAELATKKLLGHPLAEALRMRRNARGLSKWFSSPPESKDEQRADERLLRLAEATRLPGLTADEVMAVTSVVERQMVGSKEVRAAFERWREPAFADALLALKTGELPARVDDAWDGPAPLMAAMSIDDEPALFARLGALVASVREVVAFARDRGLALVPWTKETGSAWLQRRADLRA